MIKDCLSSVVSFFTSKSCDRNQNPTDANVLEITTTKRASIQPTLPNKHHNEIQNNEINDDKEKPTNSNPISNSTLWKRRFEKNSTTLAPLLRLEMNTIEQNSLKFQKYDDLDFAKITIKDETIKNSRNSTYN